MKYVSTRGLDNVGVSSAMAIKSGLASDGGLYMPYEIPKLSYEDMCELKGMTYAERAAKILSRFLSDYTLSELTEDASLAYSKDKFGSNPDAMKQAGIAYATDQIIDLFANGITNVHVYSMNKPDVAAAIQRNLSDILGK